MAAETENGIALRVTWVHVRATTQEVCRGFSPQRPRFVPGSILVGFVVSKVALGQAYILALWFSSVSIIPPCLSMPMYHMADEQ
jgi:hypothetical protein